MQVYTVALFGEAEKGDYCTAYYCRSLPQLVELLGNPPEESLGLHFAVQTLLYKRDLIYVRVREEGFSYQDYFFGLNLLENNHLIRNIAAICIPGVGDRGIIEAITPFCKEHDSFIITTEPDLYDYLTSIR